MKRARLVILFVIVAALTLATTSAFAQSAYSSAFTTSITYQNVGSGTANIMFQFYAENNGTAIPIQRTLAQGAGSSLFVGSLGEINPGFNGSVVMSSDQPVVATMVQISSNAGVKNRPLSNGFSSGAAEVLLATVLKNTFSTTSKFAVQNVSSGSVDLTIKFYNADNPAAPPIQITHANLPAGASKYFDAGQIAQLPASFNGSAVITAVQSGTSTPAPIAATVLELQTNGPAASSFEGVTGGANTVYMPSALCNAFGATSAYAVQNTSSSNAANVTVSYSNGQSESAPIAAGAKKSFIGCTVNPAGFSGSATITSTGAPIVVIGKVFGSGNSTAFVGATSGASTLALPYVRFTEAQWESGQRQRAYIAIQNVGAPLAAGTVVVKYLDRLGNQVGTHTLDAIATGAKVNTHARHPGVVGNAAQLAEFGYADGQFGGSVIVQGPGGSQLVAVVRIQSAFGSGVVGEDYNGIPVTP
jgi:hypothetical protein